MLKSSETQHVDSILKELYVDQFSEVYISQHVKVVSSILSCVQLLSSSLLLKLILLLYIESYVRSFMKSVLLSDVEFSDHLSDHSQLIYYFCLIILVESHIN